MMTPSGVLMTHLMGPNVVEMQLLLDVSCLWEPEEGRGVANPQELQKVRFRDLCDLRAYQRDSNYNIQNCKKAACWALSNTSHIGQ